MTLYSNDDYFEAKLQLRPYNKELIKYTKKLISENKTLLIVKETEHKYGIDFLTNSQKQTQKVARQLKKIFKGKIIISRKLFKVDRLTSKILYRVTVCFKLEGELKERPNKKPFSKEIMESLRNKAIEKIKSKFLPNTKIIKIMLTGSSLKDSFGKYDSPGFRGSLYSDFDFIIFVEDDYEIPEWLVKSQYEKPFPYDELNLVYRNKKFIEDKYDVEIFFIQKRNIEDKELKKLGERAGIPMTDKSANKHLIVYLKE